MRIDIKTKTAVKDRDIRALYMMVAAMESSTPRMREHNLRFIADHYGFELSDKNVKYGN